MLTGFISPEATPEPEPPSLPVIVPMLTDVNDPDVAAKPVTVPILTGSIEPSGVISSSSRRILLIMLGLGVDMGCCAYQLSDGQKA